MQQISIFHLANNYRAAATPQPTPPPESQFLGGVAWKEGDDFYWGQGEGVVAVVT